ncbi:MAG: hypothetical protein HYY25_07370 [Candidatus Wallbacteria bacterium]|nr:hypothetical protein [Candidatus Wallbacteria bacterium]
MNRKLATMAFLAAALTAVTAQAQDRLALAAQVPVQVEWSAPSAVASFRTAAPVFPSRGDRSSAPRPAAAPTQQTPPVQGTRSSDDSSVQVTGIEALKWIYAVVTSHDSKTCEGHTKGVQINFGMPY